MFIKQLFTECLSEFSYYIESDGTAAVIDPLRDVDEYLEIAKERNASIKYIFETHFHADFISGHIELANVTNATIVFGPECKARFKAVVGKDGDIFELGKTKIKLLHTPGHTLESSSYLLFDEQGKEKAVFTGDTLFVGEVGRPDLAQQSEILTTNDLAAMLYDSITTQLTTLPDHVIIYPGHGKGRACGKNIGVEKESTIGEQKISNYALLTPTKEDFIKAVISHLPEPPKYFSLNAQINKDGYESLELILEKGLKKVTIDEIKNKIRELDVVLLDTRPVKQFIDGYIPTSIFVGLEGRFAEWAANILPLNLPIIIIAEEGREKEAITRLARVGIEKVEGFLAGGFDAWKNAEEKFDLIIDIESDELAMDIPFDENLVVLDVRTEAEFGSGHLKQSMNIPLINLTDPGTMADFDDNHNIYVHCAGGYRSVIACSLLKRQGIHNIRNVNGGWNAILLNKERFTIEKEGEILN